MPSARAVVSSAAVALTGALLVLGGCTAPSGGGAVAGAAGTSASASTSASGTGSASPASSRGNELVIGLEQEPDKLNSALNAMVYGTYINNALYGYFVKYDEKMGLVP